jgi:transposase
LVWAAGLGPTDRWGIEGASGLGRHLAEFLVAAGCDVRDVRLARAFKQAAPAAPDSVRERIALWHNARTSLTKIRVQLLGELDALVHDLPEDLRSQLRPAKTVSARVNSLRRLDISDVTNPTVALRLRLIERHRVAMLREVLEQDKAATAELAKLVDEANSTLTTLVGFAPRAAAEIIVEVGDIRRFTEAGFARFNGTAPIPASSGEGENAPVRHRLSRGGNRRLNAAIYRIAMIQLRCEPRARRNHDQARAHGHSSRGHARPQAPPLQRDPSDHAPRRPTGRGLDMRASSAGRRSSASSRTARASSASSG